MNDELRKHILDLLKGALGAAITAGTLALLQYLGAHIPELLQGISMIAAGVAGVKTKIG
jgi:hypothetical protein